MRLGMGFAGKKSFNFLGGHPGAPQMGMADIAQQSVYGVIFF